MATSAQPHPSTAPVLMTLAAFAATAAVPRPSGETGREQALRARSGITAHLQDPTLATGGTWQLKWLALSPDNANLAYIAWNSDGSNQIVVAVRGTVSQPIDTMEDLDVGTVVPFTAGGSADIAVSAGAMAAFTQVATARGITGVPAGPEGADGPDAAIPVDATLAQALALLLAAVPSSPQPTVYVTGHSLGGCVATMLGAYLQNRTWTPNPPAFALVTFAAPTAGLQSFADHVDGLRWILHERHVNAYDVVPLAWSDLLEARKWYPLPQGPAATHEVKLLLTEANTLKKDNVYVQPLADSPITWNPSYGWYDTFAINRTTADFTAQVAFQHSDFSYLYLLGAPRIPAGPVVTGLSPTAGDGGTQLTISGTGFTPDSVVDFGPVPCGEFVLDLEGMWIRAVVPDGVGIVDVRVTNRFGTSPAVPPGRFAYGGPAPVVVGSVTPNHGPVGTPVEIVGSGFATSGTTVRFKDTVAHSAVVESATLIRAKVPLRPLDGSNADDAKTVDVTVTVGVATSPTGPVDEFTYEAAPAGEGEPG
ncbi:IPT/TIG domain-containing protein [Streptomyces sp. NBC_01276]|uniref:lipase family protein n=1 Tax=Streptomyces sp. NBC_01276 TaxID=2903808 RepID=UPI00352DFAAC